MSEFSLVFTPTSVSFITVRALVVAATSTRKELFAAQTEVSRICSRCSPFCPGPNAADSWSNLAWATAVVGNYTPGPDGSGFDRAPGRMAALKATDPLEGTAAPPLVVLHIIERTGASMATAPAVETGGRGAGQESGEAGSGGRGEEKTAIHRDVLQAKGNTKRHGNHPARKPGGIRDTGSEPF